MFIKYKKIKREKPVWRTGADAPLLIQASPQLTDNRNHLKEAAGNSHKILLSLIYQMVILVLITLTACQRLGVVMPDVQDQPLSISASDSVVVLEEQHANESALKLSWTTGTNYGTGSAISYTLQIDQRGNNFQDAIAIDLGKQVYSYDFSAKDLNTRIRQHFNLNEQQTLDLAARVIAEVAGLDGKETQQEQVSPAVTFTVQSYQPVSTTLYIIGDATPTGWDNQTATAMSADPEKSGTFTYQGALTAGHFKFITTLGSFLPSYNKGTDDKSLILRNKESDPDNQFVINEGAGAIYKITVDLLAMTMQMEKVNLSPYDKLWIIGDAVPQGWDIASPDSMIHDPGSPFVFKYGQVLKAGEFKIATAATGDFNIPFYMPITNHPPLTDKSVQLVAPGADDYKWQITAPGAYKIQLDLQSMQIAIKPFTPYAKLWLVGDATPAGWNIDDPTPMTATPGDPYTFTYQGQLSAGEFKITVATGDWGTDFFRPYSQHPDITDTKAQWVAHGSSPADVNDFKWQIKTAGLYTIRLNQLLETIEIIKQ